MTTPPRVTQPTSAKDTLVSSTAGDFQIRNDVLVDIVLILMLQEIEVHKVQPIQIGGSCTVGQFVLRDPIAVPIREVGDLIQVEPFLCPSSV